MLGDETPDGRRERVAVGIAVSGLDRIRPDGGNICFRHFCLGPHGSGCCGFCLYHFAFANDDCDYLADRYRGACIDADFKQRTLCGGGNFHLHLV